jgi:hypothetical protein
VNPYVALIAEVIKLLFEWLRGRSETRIQVAEQAQADKEKRDALRQEIRDVVRSGSVSDVNRLANRLRDQRIVRRAAARRRH